MPYQYLASYDISPQGVTCSTPPQWEKRRLEGAEETTKTKQVMAE
tara:strand:+ start:122 stop:256 length:135 start_codon:yes stop_codon:yes gene_type:complete